jgi:hypothetical protein
MDIEDDLVNIANAIYSLLAQEKEVKSEEELFSDKVYIDMIGTLLQNIKGEITPGKTPEEKIENINLLLSLLYKIFGREFEIDARKIVIEKDKDSAKTLLVFLFTLLNSGAEFEEEEDEFEERKMNISDPGMKYNEESVESLRLGKDKKKDKKMKKEDNMNIKGLDKEKSQSGENLIYDKDDMDLDNINDNEEKKNNSEIEVDDEIIRKNTDEENINLTNENDNEINSEKKTYDIPGLLEGEIEKSKSKSKSNIE